MRGISVHYEHYTALSLCVSNVTLQTSGSLRTVLVSYNFLDLDLRPIITLEEELVKPEYSTLCRNLVDLELYTLG
jgi:hypothetical protein